MKTLLIKENSKFYFDQSTKYCYSRAKFYGIKKKVNEFFEITGLNNNLIKRILFISWLECEMGIQCIPKYIKNVYENKFKNIIDKLCYLTNSEKKKFNVILQTFFIFDLNQIEVPSDMFFLEFCLYDRDQKILDEINEFWKVDVSINSSSVIFFYKLLSSNFLMPVFLSKEYVDKLLNNFYIKQIVLDLEKNFSIELCINYKFLGVFFNFIKYSCLDVLDFFIPNESITTLLGESIYLKVKHIFENVGMNVNNKSLRYLSNHIFSFIMEKNDRIKIYIYSDSLLEFYEIYYFLKQNLKIDVELVDVWLNKPDQLISIEGEKRIVVSDGDSLDNLVLLKAETFVLRKPFTVKKIEKLSNYILKMKYSDIRTTKFEELRY